MGNDIQFGIDIDLGGHRHGGRDDRRYPHNQPQIDPITFEARQIANELDRGDTHRAAEHMRRELQQMPTFHHQKRLVETIDAFDRKGVGADIRLGRPDRQGGIWDDISIIPPRFYDRDPRYGGGRPPIYGDPGYGRPGYGHGRPDYGNRRPEVDIRIDLNLFKNHRR
ncbi:MAG: hypothetical protein SGJ27_17410 [Candidatus Melainabacteria bacterium]|nr:hypothetical protein [Candidatus Melainabacteria bacterium]